MIELQHVRIGLAAVNAGMCSQVVEDKGSVPTAIALGVCSHIRDVLSAVIAIPRTLTAAAVPLLTEFARSVERRQRKGLSAAAAPSRLIFSDR